MLADMGVVEVIKVEMRSLCPARSWYCAVGA
jgi:hypothetical protein